MLLHVVMICIGPSGFYSLSVRR